MLRGFEALATEPCCWRLMVPDGKGGERVAGLRATHVDDFLFCGDENEPKYRNALTYLYEKFIWTLWEDGNFEHCGIDLIRHSDDRFVLDHSKFCDKLDQVVMEKERRADHEPASENEKAQLRGLLGSIQWRVIQSAPQHAAQLSMLQTEMANATVKTIRDANKLCREVVHDKNAVMTISPLKVLDPTEVCFVAWSDAALGNRPNGGSTGGYVVAATSPDLLEGKPATLNFVAWRSGRLPRVARSSLAAEVQAFSEAEEELMWCRLQWAEMCGKNVPFKQPETIVASVKGVMVTDAKSLYDVIQKGDQATSGIGLKEKYSALEIMSVVQRLELCKTMTRWVHSDAQIADALTKRLSTSALKRVLSVNTWTLVEDPTFTSAKRLKRGFFRSFSRSDLQQLPNDFCSEALQGDARTFFCAAENAWSRHKPGPLQGRLLYASLPESYAEVLAANLDMMARVNQQRCVTCNFSDAMGKKDECDGRWRCRFCREHLLLQGAKDLDFQLPLPDHEVRELRAKLKQFFLTGRQRWSWIAGRFHRGWLEFRPANVVWHSRHGVGTWHMWTDASGTTQLAVHLQHALEESGPQPYQNRQIQNRELREEWRYTLVYSGGSMPVFEETNRKVFRALGFAWEGSKSSNLGRIRLEAQSPVDPRDPNVAAKSDNGSAEASIPAAARAPAPAAASSAGESGADARSRLSYLLKPKAAPSRPPAPPETKASPYWIYYAPDFEDGPRAYTSEG
eukprot:s5062_g1.t1